MLLYKIAEHCKEVRHRLAAARLTMLNQAEGDALLRHLARV